jgi:hypothetical protein
MLVHQSQGLQGMQQTNYVKRNLNASNSISSQNGGAPTGIQMSRQRAHQINSTLAMMQMDQVE